ncbi:putative transcription factor IIE alpha subunit [Cryptosporidium canis]|uniref:Transcription factor IIE alpha subunit n=1 Tax=Cryptosporidium canis TaxID=195482 RepID=A0A9D5HXA1_9CRYT|nr:putative transcription factor IIE alpha subunit [Cryptosporidium canis]
MNKQDPLPNRNNYDIQQFPYNPESFKTFVQILLRLFHDSPAIIVGDCLIREQKSFTDRDLAIKLNLSDRQVREALRHLEDDLIVVKDQKPIELLNQLSNLSPDQSSIGKAISGTSGSSTDVESRYSLGQGGLGFGSSYSTSSGLPSNRVGPSFYRINPYLPAVVEWQYSTIIHEIDQEMKDAVNLDELICHSCNARYSSLEALSLDLNPEDGLFLCRFCNDKLKSVDSASFRNIAKDRAERVRSQLQILSNSLELVKNMNVPIFPPYQSRNDAMINRTKLPTGTESEANSQAAKSSISNDTPTPNLVEKTSSPPSGGAPAQQLSALRGLGSSSSPPPPQHTVSKVKFGIKLSAKSTNSSLGVSNAGGIKKELYPRAPSMGFSVSSTAAAKTAPGGQTSGLGAKESDPSSVAADPPPKSPSKVEEPTFSISAIKDRIFKITEIDDDIINQMTDSEYLRYDELLQKYQTLGLINT